MQRERCLLLFTVIHAAQRAHITPNTQPARLPLVEKTRESSTDVVTCRARWTGEALLSLWRDVDGVKIEEGGD